MNIRKVYRQLTVIHNPSQSHIKMNVKYFLVCLVIHSVNGKSRQRRHLRFPKGSAFIITVAISTFLPKDVPNGFAQLIEFDLGYPFPEMMALDRPRPMTTTTQPDIYYDPHYNSIIVNRKDRVKRSKVDIEKEKILAKLQEIISSLGFDGPSCSARFQCELQRLSPNRSMVEDILLVLFLPSTFHPFPTCENSFKTCPISILQIIFHSEKVTDKALFF